MTALSTTYLAIRAIVLILEGIHYLQSKFEVGSIRIKIISTFQFIDLVYHVIILSRTVFLFNIHDMSILEKDMFMNLLQ